MQVVTTCCDMCKKSSKEEYVEIRIGDLSHDLCKSCDEKLKKLLQGSGREIKSIYSGGILSGGQPGQGYVPVVNNPLLNYSATTTTAIPGTLWKDNIVGISNTGSMASFLGINLQDGNIGQYSNSSGLSFVVSKQQEALTDGPTIKTDVSGTITAILVN